MKKRNKTAAYWCDQISTYEREFSKWQERSKKIVKRYKDERNNNENTKARFNILWSNVQTLAPALYAKNPVPNVDRRFEDDDKVGTTAARVLERSVTYYVDNDLFGNVMSQVVLDRLLPGRGVAWVRYVPNFKEEIEGPQEVKQEGTQVTDDENIGDEATPELYSEDVVIDYVHWTDFLHGWGRTWEEVPWVGRKVYMTRQELTDRFENGKDVPLDKGDKSDEEKVGHNKACVYEIWDKKTREAIWIHKSMETELDKRPDPLQLHDFFPCPKPVYSTLANDNLIPSPDYTQYQDQARELDILTARIDALQKALKVVGVYDKNAEGLSRILSEGLDNTMVPVENWALYAEKGGIANAVGWFPVEQVANVLLQLYEAREKVKQDLYEITGISDIIRGATDANETATAQQIKGQFATLRLDNMQKDVARFSRDLVRIMAEIIAEHFDLETIKQISGIKLLTTVEKQQLQAQTSQPGPPGPDGQPASQPVPDELQELLDSPTWEEVEALLRDDTLRCFRISIETDSTIKADQEAEKAQRVELIGAVGGFLQQAIALPPQLQPLAAELLMFGVRGFKISREIETTFDQTLKKIKKASEAPPQPSPEMIQAQAEEKKMANDAQMEDKKIQFETQKMGVEKELAGQKFQIENKKLDNERLSMRLEAKTKVQPDVAMSDPDMNDMPVTPLQASVTQGLQEMAMMMAQGFQQLAEQQNANANAILQVVSAPKKTEVIRGPDGKITGGVSRVETLQ